MFTSPLLDLPGVVHAFGTRHDDMAALLPDYWTRRPIQHERHGIRIAVASEAGEDCGEADGMLTDRPGLLLAIATADCVPVLLARRDGKEVAALHAGWRGAQAGIVDAFAQLLRARGGDPADWVAATGPAAHACCYEVGVEVVEGFVARWGYDTGFVASRLASGAWRLKLPDIVRRQLGAIGVHAVAGRSECTMCHMKSDGRPTFHSYRRDRATRTPVLDVHWSAIAIAGL